MVKMYGLLVGIAAVATLYTLFPEANFQPEFIYKTQKFDAKQTSNAYHPISLGSKIDSHSGHDYTIKQSRPKIVKNGVHQEYRGVVL